MPMTATARPRPSTDSAYRHRHGNKCHSRHYSTPQTRPVVPVSYTINENSTIHVTQTPEKPIYYLPVSLSTHCEHLHLHKAPSASNRAAGVPHEVYIMSHTPTTHKWTFMPTGTHVPPGVCEQKDVTGGGVIKFKHVRVGEWLIGSLATFGGGGAEGGAEGGGAGEGHYEVTWTVYDQATDCERTIRLRCESDNVTWKLLPDSQLHPPTPPPEASEEEILASMVPATPPHADLPIKPKYAPEVVIAVEKIRPHIGHEAGETIQVHFERPEVTDEVFEVLMCAWLTKCWRERIKHKGWFTARDHDSKTHGLKFRW